MMYFPGLNLKFYVKRIAFNFLGINIYYYAICIIIGILTAVVLCKTDKNNFGIKFDYVLESLMFALIIGFIGARIYYVLFNFDYYKYKPMKIFNIRNGGLAFYGGLIAGFLVIIYRCNKYKIDLLDFFDYTAPFIAIAQSIGRWGNFFNQEAYGIETNNIFRMGINAKNGYIEVHPVFLYESVATLVIFVILIKLQKNRRFKGEICYLYLFLYSSVRIWTEALRIDSLMFGNFRISQVLSIAIFVVFGIMLLKNYKKTINYRLQRLK